MTYVPADDRYERMSYRRCGRSGLDLPAISLGLWWNFGGDRPFERSRAIARRAFDLGVTHFDLAFHLRRTALPRPGTVTELKALYAGISSYSAETTREAYAILRDLGTPLLIHQPSYSMLNRWIEPDLLDALGELGVGCIAFSPLAQGMLTTKYLDGIPEGSRASWPSSLSPELLTDEALARIRALNEIAAARSQTLAQMALAWVLRDRRITSALIGASSVEQLEENLDALARLAFSDDELAEIDRYAAESNINIWAASSEA